jgi:ketosteroid isomerase-like protein
MWLRATLGFRKIDGNWFVTHEHSSVPFEVESGKAAVTLKP